jgi:fucose permease
MTPLSVVAPLAAGFVLGGLPASLFGLKRPLADHFGADQSQVDAWLRRCLLLPSVFFLPLAGLLADRIGARDVALFGAFFSTIGLALIGLMPRSERMLVNLAGVALGMSLLAVGVLDWMPTALGAPGRDVESMNLGFVAVGLGWLVGPRLAELTVRWAGVRRTLLFGAATTLALIGLLYSAEFTEPVAPPVADVYQDLRFWLLIAVLLLYIPVESCLGAWSDPFVRELAGTNEHGVRTRFIAFWIAFLGARLFVWWFLGPGYEAWFLLVCAFVSAMTVGNLVGAYALSSGTVGFLAVGFCYGPLLPGLLGMMHGLFSHPGTLLGTLLAAGCLYQFALNPFVCRQLQRHTPRQAMRLPMALMLLLCVPLLTVAMMREPPPTAPRPVPAKRSLNPAAWFRSLFHRT